MKNPLHSSWLPLSAGVLCCVFVASQATGVRSQTEAEAEAPAAAPPSSPLGPVTAAMRQENLPEAARLLKAIDRGKLSPADLGRWDSLASRVALRLGDTDWLKHINRNGNLETNAEEFLILNAMRYLLAAKPTEARNLLKQIKDHEILDDIPQRRYMQLMARIEQVEGNKEAEMVWVRKLVDYVAGWDKRSCQSCHANPKLYGTDVTTFDYNSWWLGKRYGELLIAMEGSEAALKDADKDLKADPKDTAAALRRAYALRTLNKEAQAKQEIAQTFPWAKAEGRPDKKALRFAVFP